MTRLTLPVKLFGGTLDRAAGPFAVVVPMIFRGMEWRCRSLSGQTKIFELLLRYNIDNAFSKREIHPRT